MKREEYDEIIRLLKSIQEVAYDKYMNIYMPYFNTLGGNKLINLLPPVDFAKKEPLICLDEAIQLTNIAFVYQLNHAIMLRAKLVQNQPSRRTAFQREIDGVNYMADMTNQMATKRGHPNRIQIQDLSYQANYQDIIATLKSILDQLKKL